MLALPVLNQPDAPPLPHSSDPSPAVPEAAPRPVGGTPLVSVDGIFAKLECTNPCGSVKDRIASFILRESERTGLLRPGMHIVEATSGNTGIALSYFARAMGYGITIVMPENMTRERQEMIRSLGAELILCSEEGSFAEAAAIRDRLAVEKGWFNPDQFSNPLNPLCHELTTGREILQEIDRRGETIDAFVAGVGTGGTLIGVGRALRKRFPRVQVVAVEPLESAVMSGGPAGTHGIAGIGDGFIPAIAGDGRGGIHPMIDDVICIASSEAREAALELARTCGCCVGISSGANFLAARKLSEQGLKTVTIFPDSYGRYRSQGLVHCQEGACPYEHEPVI